jgi:hypothetical protein
MSLVELLEGPVDVDLEEARLCLAQLSNPQSRWRGLPRVAGG